MPIPDDAVLVIIPCRRCPREHFLYVDPDTRHVLDYDGARAPVRAGESLPAAFFRLLNAPCDECQRVWDLGPGIHRPPPGRPRRSSLRRPGP